MNKETKDQIAREAQEKYPYLLSRSDLNHIKDKRRAAYIAGAETWAERGEVLKEALEKVRKYFPDTTAHAQDIDKALSKFNNHK